MPIKIPEELPAAKILENENIFVMTESRAATQDIRPLRIAIFNIMPTKEITETQLLRLLGNSPLQVDCVFVHPKTHVPKNTDTKYLQRFYTTFDKIKQQRFDGLVITGAPVEKLEYTDVTYWNELKEIMDWANTHVTSTFYICWAAQAGLYHKYGVPKFELDEKMSGVYKHRVLRTTPMLLRGFDDVFYAPHSRYTEVRQADIEKVNELEILSVSDTAGVFIVVSRDKRNIFVTGHLEYDVNTLDDEYKRDVAKGINPALPENYYQNGTPTCRWRAHANLLFSNWLNYYVYQLTPYDLDNAGEFSDGCGI